MDNDIKVIDSWWKTISIRKKIQYSIMCFAIIVLIMTTVSIALSANAYFTQSNEKALSILAQVLAENSKAALTFDDANSAGIILEAVNKNPDIISAVIYKGNQIFSAYPADSTFATFDLNETQKNVWREQGNYFALAPITIKGQPQGWLKLHAQSNVWALLGKNLISTITLLLISIAMMTYFMSYWLKKHVTAPLHALSDWAIGVYQKKNFKARAQKHSNDEIGRLADSLNAMLVELSKQESIISLNHELEAEVSTRKATELELIQMRDKAEKANRSKSDFLANMSHEIRTPMNAIIGFVDLLLEEQIDEKHLKHLHTVRNSAQDLHNLLNDILDVAKLEEGKLELESSPFSVQELVAQVIKTFELKANAKGLQLIQRISPNVSKRYLGDALRLKQVLINIIGNGIKFTATGSIMIAVEQLSDETLQFIIRDTGIGIAKNKLDKIFESFSQADTSTSRKFGGTGLGTTISKKLVELMQGKIWLESDEGVGSTFYFTIKLTPTELATNTDTYQIDSNLLKTDKPLNILVAEDGEQNAELLKIRLEGLGHCFHRAVNGQEAVNLFTEQEFDIVLMDIQMPVMDGLQAAEQIRQLPDRKYVPIIALTASVMHEDRKACFAVGMDGFVKKPIVFNELFTEISKLMHNRVNLQTSETQECNQKNLPKSAYINFEQGVNTWSSIAVYTKNLKQFARSHENDMVLLNGEIENHDLIAAERLVHALKGTAGNLALIDLFDELLIMNGYLKRKDITAAKDHINILTNTFKASLNAINQLTDFQPTDVEHIELDLNQLAEDVEKQIACLLNGELNDEALLVILKQIKQMELPDQLDKRLQEALDDFEFDLAAKLLSEFLTAIQSLEKRHDTGK